MSTSTDDHSADRGFAAEPCYVTDLDRCEPAAALAAEPLPGRWRTIDYETEDFGGAMLVAGPETQAPEVRYPLSSGSGHFAPGLLPIQMAPTSLSRCDMARRA